MFSSRSSRIGGVAAVGAAALLAWAGWSRPEKEASVSGTLKEAGDQTKLKELALETPQQVLRELEVPSDLTKRPAAVEQVVAAPLIHTFRVKDENGNPVSGARITIGWNSELISHYNNLIAQQDLALVPLPEFSNYGLFPAITTNQAGLAELQLTSEEIDQLYYRCKTYLSAVCLFPNQFNFLVRHPSFLDFRHDSGVDFDPEHPGVSDCALRRGLTAHIRVVDRETGAALPKAYVRIGSRRTREIEASTNDQGYVFTLGEGGSLGGVAGLDPQHGSFEVLVDARGYAPRLEIIRLSHAIQDSPALIELDREGSAKCLRLLDKQTGKILTPAPAEIQVESSLSAYPLRTGAVPYRFSYGSDRADPFTINDDTIFVSEFGAEASLARVNIKYPGYDTLVGLALDGVSSDQGVPTDVFLRPTQTWSIMVQEVLAPGADLEPISIRANYVCSRISTASKPVNHQKFWIPPDSTVRLDDGSTVRMYELQFVTTEFLSKTDLRGLTLTGFTVVARGRQQLVNIPPIVLCDSESGGIIRSITTPIILKRD